MPPKRKRYDSHSISEQLDRSSRDGVERLFQKKFSYSAIDIEGVPFSPQSIFSSCNFSTNIKSDETGYKCSSDNIEINIQRHAQASEAKEKVSETSQELIDTKEVSETLLTSKSMSKETVSETLVTHEDNEKTLLPNVEDVNLDSIEIWKDKNLMKMKSELNDLKEQLSDKDLTEWHKHTSFTNMAGNIVSQLKQEYHVELCTQAWSKFYEILSTWNIIPLNGDTVSTVHLCEAPGAFITALNHYIVQQAYTGMWQWLGTTLSPYHEGNDLTQMIDDDRFIRSSLDNWYFGEDQTGDIMNLANLQGLIERTKLIGNVQLVTADGSIDCQNTPSEQEMVVSHLHHCEVLAAFHLLSPGGAFVIKFFTMFESSTISLMYLLRLQFDELHVYKPSTSKGGNSEVYVVCRGFKKWIKDDMIKLLSQFYFSQPLKDEVSIFPESGIPDSFIEEHRRCCQYFIDCQSDTITTNLSLFENFPGRHRAMMDQLRDYCTEVFVSKYRIHPIPAYMKIVQQHRKESLKFCVSVCTKSKDKGTQRPTTFDKMHHRTHTGSFKNRMETSKLPWQQQILCMEKAAIMRETLCLTSTECLHPSEILSWSVTKGRSLHKILSSRMCDGPFVRKMVALLDHVNVESTRTRCNAKVYEEVANMVMEFVMRFTEEPLQSVIIYANDTLKELLVDALPAENLFNSADGTNKSDGRIVVVSIIDPHLKPGSEELHTRGELLKKLIIALKDLPEGSHLVLHMYSSLTFFTIGLLYILARLFESMTQCQHLPDVCLQQVLYFESLSDLHPSVITYLEHVESEVNQSEEGTDVLDILPKSILINDPCFVRFCVNMNKTLIGRFVNNVIDLEKETFTSSAKEKTSDCES